MFYKLSILELVSSFLIIFSEIYLSDTVAKTLVCWHAKIFYLHCYMIQMLFILSVRRVFYF